MKKLAVLFLALMLLLAACGSAEPAETTTVPQETTEAARTPAPDFTVYDGDGNPVKLSDFLGKPVVLNFWASWCGPCKNEMPEFDEVWQEYGGEVAFVMVNLTDGSYETLDTAKEFLAGAGYGFPMYFDTGSEGANAYGISSIPTTYLIDAEGYVVAYATGSIDKDTLLYGISLIYSE